MSHNEEVACYRHKSVNVLNENQISYQNDNQVIDNSVNEMRLCAISIGSNGPEGHREVQVVGLIVGDERTQQAIESEGADMSTDCQSVGDTEMSNEIMRPALDDRPITTADTNSPATGSTINTNVSKQLFHKFY